MTENDKLLANAKKLIKNGKLDDAQAVLYSINEREGQWHFVQSELYYKRNWLNESRKNLEIAMEIEPDNETYRTVYAKLCEYAEADETFKNPYSKRQMGKSHWKDGCGEACLECGGICCCEMLCEAVCDGC